MLLGLGVEIYLYRKGLLHTKSIMVDGAMSMFGTVNLDMRSLWLNYEVALFVYEPEFAQELRALQQTYLEDSDRLDPVTLTGLAPPPLDVEREPARSIPSGSCVGQHREQLAEPRHHLSPLIA